MRDPVSETQGRHTRGITHEVDFPLSPHRPTHVHTHTHKRRRKEEEKEKKEGEQEGSAIPSLLPATLGA